MNQIDQIKKLQRQGYGPKETAARLGIDRKTSAKYMLMDDWNPAAAQPRQVPSTLDRVLGRTPNCAIVIRRSHSARIPSGVRHTELETFPCSQQFSL